MTRRLARAVKYHPPRQVRDASVELAIDEVPQPACRDAERTERRDEIHQPQETQLVAARFKRHGDDDAQQAAVEGHPALPHRDDLERVRQVVAQLVEEHVAKPPAENHPENRREQQIVELLPRHRREALCDSPQAQPPAGGEADEIHEAVPAHRERADGKRDRVDIRVDQHYNRSLQHRRHSACRTTGAAA